MKCLITLVVGHFVRERTLVIHSITVPLFALAQTTLLANGNGIGNIPADYSFPAFTLLKHVVGWVLAGATILCFLALILAVIGVLFKGFGNERLRGAAIGNIGYIIAGTVILSAITGIFAYFQGLDLGFGQ